ncbi:MAG: hypothetical protein OXG37_16260 [Actinomycetia bacterium]|nr:hypothetical protein [Actinomycetes bacterium]
MSTYLVFGRSDYAEPLRQLGTLEAPDHADARERFGMDVIELSLLPEPEVVWVIHEAAAE